MINISKIALCIWLSSLAIISLFNIGKPPLAEPLPWGALLTTLVVFGFTALLGYWIGQSEDDI